MQTKALDRITKLTSMSKISSSKSPKNISLDALDAVEEKINKIWNMFENQLQRNFELMAYIDKQHEVIQKMMTSSYNGIMPGNTTTIQSRPAEELQSQRQKVEPIPLNKLRILTENFRKIFHYTGRVDGIQNMINILYTLLILDKQLTPDDIAFHTGIAPSSCYRIIAKLKSLRLANISSIRGCSISQIGSDFIEEKLTAPEQYSSIINKPPYKYG